MEVRHYVEQQRLEQCRRLEELNRTAWMYESWPPRQRRGSLRRALLGWLPGRSA